MGSNSRCLSIPDAFVRPALIEHELHDPQFSLKHEGLLTSTPKPSSEPRTAMRTRRARRTQSFALRFPSTYSPVSARRSGRLPARNRCWFAARVVEVRKVYGLTIDRSEADALERASSHRAIPLRLTPWCARCRQARPPAPLPAPAAADHALAFYDDNGNGRITCPEALRHGIAPVPRSHPAYRYMRDGDADGVACE